MERFLLKSTREPSAVIADISQFDRQSGSIVERLLFNNRPVILLACLLLTLFLGVQATHVKLNASFDKMIPVHQPFIVNYYAHYAELQGQGNAIHIAVEANHGTVINAHYLSMLRALNDQVFLLPGVDRPYMSSLWTPNTRWYEVTPDGISSGNVITQAYDGSPQQLQIVMQNILKTGQVGSLVSPNFKSSMIYVPLMATNNITGKPLDYGKLGRALAALRSQYANQGVTLHITGFAKILWFFVLSVLIATAMLYAYTRCLRSTCLVVLASLVAVTWQIGLLPMLGFDLNPYSVLVPFLIFAIGMSHGAQKMNGVMQDIGRGTHPLIAARYTFRRLFLAGFAALTCDAVSFAVLLSIHIAAIRELAVIASIGVGILIFTNLIMLPMILSYTGVSITAARRSMRDERDADLQISPHPMWRFLDLFTQPRYAALAIGFSVVLGVIGWQVGRGVQVGDLDKGAPELRSNSQYNQDAAFISANYATGGDTMVIMTDTPAFQCNAYKVVSTLDALEWRLQQLPMVQSTSSIGTQMRAINMLLTEGSPKWFDIPNDQNELNDDYVDITPNLTNSACSFAPLYVSLTDHKARSLDAVVTTVQKFIADPAHKIDGVTMTLAGGNAGIEAATNNVIGQANAQMLYLVYAAVILFCLITFRSWRAVLCAVLPLILTSILSQAIMVWLGIGIKVATLPVIALGVGIGVDYALYVLSIVLKHQRNGETLSVAYYRTLIFTGRVVLLTGCTLAAGVATWVFAPIKFQADMGLLLSFMFLWNMLGALILLPSLACFLLPNSLFQKERARRGSQINFQTIDNS
jgi:predicted RND superfamily exporter protein